MKKLKLKKSVKKYLIIFAFIMVISSTFLIGGIKAKYTNTAGINNNVSVALFSVDLSDNDITQSYTLKNVENISEAYEFSLSNQSEVTVIPTLTVEFYESDGTTATTLDTIEITIVDKNDSTIIYYGSYNDDETAIEFDLAQMDMPDSDDYYLVFSKGADFSSYTSYSLKASVTFTQVD